MSSFVHNEASTNEGGDILPDATNEAEEMSENSGKKMMEMLEELTFLNTALLAEMKLTNKTFADSNKLSKQTLLVNAFSILTSQKAAFPPFDECSSEILLKRSYISQAIDIVVFFMQDKGSFLNPNHPEHTASGIFDAATDTQLDESKKAINVILTCILGKPPRWDRQAPEGQEKKMHVVYYE